SISSQGRSSASQAWWTASGSSTPGSAETVEQRPRLLQVGRVEPLGEPAVRLGQQRQRLAGPAQTPPQAGPARRPPQPQRPPPPPARALQGRGDPSPPPARRPRPAQQQPPPQAVQPRLVQPLARPARQRQRLLQHRPALLDPPPPEQHVGQQAQVIGLVGE